VYAQLQAYKTVEMIAIPDGRELEASILSKAAHMLIYCKKNWEASDNNSRLDESLRFNQNIWSIFQAELAKSDNPLPQKLRENLLSLSLFIDKRIMEIMIDPLPEKLNIIININLNIAAGLRDTQTNSNSPIQAGPISFRSRSC
jgi:flagellar biosynthesis activator protein FlaF